MEDIFDWVHTEQTCFQPLGIQIQNLCNSDWLIDLEEQAVSNCTMSTQMLKIRFIAAKITAYVRIIAKEATIHALFKSMITLKLFVKELASLEILVKTCFNYSKVLYFYR